MRISGFFGSASSAKLGGLGVASILLISLVQGCVAAVPIIAAEAYVGSKSANKQEEYNLAVAKMSCGELKNEYEKTDSKNHGLIGTVYQNEAREKAILRSEMQRRSCPLP